MSPRKVLFLAMLGTILVFAAVGRLSVQTRGFGLRMPNSQLHDPGLALNGALGHAAQAEDKLGRSHRVKSSHSKGEMPPTIFLPVQSRNAKDLGTAKLLVAKRELPDPHFAKTVVLLIRYDAEGAVGLILNRRTDVPLSRVFEGLKAAKERSDPAYLGGPVETSTAFALLQWPAKLEGAEQVLDGVYLIPKTLFEQTISARPDPGAFHVYLGYAAWVKDQLRKEVERGDWFIFQADVRTVFDSDPDSLWSKMILKTELKVAGSAPADADQRTVICDNTSASKGALRREFLEP